MIFFNIFFVFFGAFLSYFCYKINNDKMNWVAYFNLFASAFNFVAVIINL